jgi:hypothetical protein
MGERKCVFLWHPARERPRSAVAWPKASHGGLIRLRTIRQPTSPSGLAGRDRMARVPNGQMPGIIPCRPGTET